MVAGSPDEVPGGADAPVPAPSANTDQPPGHVGGDTPANAAATTTGALRKIASVLSVGLVMLFIVLLYFFIATASQTAAIVIAARDLEDGYKKTTELFAAEKAAEAAADLADFDAKNAAPDKMRDDLIANQKRSAAVDEFSKQASEFFQIVCYSILDLKELHYPVRAFVSITGVLDCDPPVDKVLQQNIVDGGQTNGQASHSNGMPSVERQVVLPRTGPQNIYIVKKKISAAASVSSFYVLPVLFGVMGAFIFTIRELLDNRNNWADFQAVTSYYLRVALGGICGMVIGYFNISSGAASAGSAAIATSPLVFSLVAGFSVDSVISVLERIAMAIRYDNTGGNSIRTTHSAPQVGVKAKPDDVSKGS